MGKRSFGQITRLPSKRHRARYTGPDGGLHNAPGTFSAKIDAEAWLAAERHLFETGGWTSPGPGSRRASRPTPRDARTLSASTPAVGSPVVTTYGTPPARPTARRWNHTVFQIECIERMYLNVYVPQLQYPAGIVGYVHRQLGLPIASTAPLVWPGGVSS
jgi:hypothetical protein